MLIWGKDRKYDNKQLSILNRTLFTPITQLLLQFFLGRQIELILRGVNIGVLRQRQFHQSVIFELAKENPHSRIFLWQFHMAIKVVHIHLHLAQILMRQFPDFQVYQHIAAQQSVEKDQIDIKMICTEREPFLPGFK